MIINPSALPSGAGLRFTVGAEHEATVSGIGVGLDGLVQASPQCTGS